MPDMLLYVVGNYEKVEMFEQEAHWMVTNGRKMCILFLGFQLVTVFSNILSTQMYKEQGNIMVALVMV